MAPAGTRRLVHRAPCLEELEKLLPGLLLLPTTVLADDFKEAVDRAFAIALGVVKKGEVEARSEPVENPARELADADAANHIDAYLSIDAVSIMSGMSSEKPAEERDLCIELIWSP